MVLHGCVFLRRSLKETFFFFLGTCQEERSSLKRSLQAGVAPVIIQTNHLSAVAVPHGSLLP